MFLFVKVRDFFDFVGEIFLNGVFFIGELIRIDLDFFYGGLVFFGMFRVFLFVLIGVDVVVVVVFLIN